MNAVEFLSLVTVSQTAIYIQVKIIISNTLCKLVLNILRFEVAGSRKFTACI